MSDAQWGNEYQEETKDKLKHPRRFTVILHNDHYTSQEFVVLVLRDIFKLAQAEAFEIMMSVHKEGRGMVGNYSLDVARSKAAKAQNLARANEFPLKCTVEPLSGE